MDLLREFRTLEERWAQAIIRKDVAELDRRWLSSTYELRISDDPARHIPRADWLATLPVYNIHHFEIQEFQAKALADTVVTSFIAKMEADVAGVDRSADFFIVDIWIKNGADWTVGSRYSAPLQAVPKMPATSR